MHGLTRVRQFTISEGHLIVRFDDGCTEELYSGEVSVRAAEYPHTV